MWRRLKRSNVPTWALLMPDGAGGRTIPRITEKWPRAARTAGAVATESQAPPRAARYLQRWLRARRVAGSPRIERRPDVARKGTGGIVAKDTRGGTSYGIRFRALGRRQFAHVGYAADGVSRRDASAS